MIEAIIGVVGTLLGTVVGFFLSERGTKRREERNEKRQAQSVRTMVSMEIDRNLELLEESWREVNDTPESDDDQEARKRVLARRFIELPLPTWNRESLDSQLLLLPMALSEQQIVRVFQFYDRLSKLGAIRTELAMAAEVQREEWMAASGGQGMIPMHISHFLRRKFDEKAPTYWGECQRNVENMLTEGNPLKARSNGR